MKGQEVHLVYVTMGIMRIFTISSRQCKFNYRIKLVVNCNFCAKSLASGRMCQKLNLASKEFIIQIGNIFSLLFRVILQKETWLYKFINEKEYVHIISRIHCQGASEKIYNPLARLTGSLGQVKITRAEGKYRSILLAHVDK